MKEERFDVFTLLIDGIHKVINKIKTDNAQLLGVKSVHLFWIYQLGMCPEGLTAAELASKTMIDRSLISREIEELCGGGYVDIAETSRGKRRSYNSRITLSERGRELAELIRREALRIQHEVDSGITPEELETMYSTLQKIYTNFKKITINEDVIKE